jgi:hypothetical protein
MKLPFRALNPVRFNSRALSTVSRISSPKEVHEFLQSNDSFKLLAPVLGRFNGAKLLKLSIKTLNSIFDGQDMASHRAEASDLYETLHPTEQEPGACVTFPFAVSALSSSHRVLYIPCCFMPVSVLITSFHSVYLFILPYRVAAPVSVRINMGDEDKPSWQTKDFDTQARLEKFLQRLGAGGLRNGDDNLVDNLAALKQGGWYTLEFANASGFSKLKKQADNASGMLTNLAAGFEHEVRACALQCIALHFIVLYSIPSHHIAVFLPLTVLIHFTHRRHVPPSNRNSMRRTTECTGSAILLIFSKG